MTQPSARAARAAALLGDDFQHLHAWSEALEAAQPGSDVTTFSVEAIEAGSYDDIVVRHASNPHLYIQAKFAVDPTDGFSLDWLMTPTGSGTERPSLAQRALATYRQLHQPGRSPQLRLVTNRDLHPDGAWLRLYRIPETNTLGHVRARLLVLDAFDDDLTDVVVLLVVLVLAADRHDPEPLQAEQQRRSVSHARGSQVG